MHMTSMQDINDRPYSVHFTSHFYESSSGTEKGNFIKMFLLIRNWELSKMLL